jgi:hypothetical protein
MSFIKTDVKGLRDINRSLKRLKGRTAHNIMRAGTRAAANEYKKGMQNNLPAEHKKKVNIAASRRESSKTRHTFKIGPLSEHWPLAFLEFGVPPHDITPKTKKVLSDAGGFVTAKVSHPGVTKIAFMRRAFSAKSDDAEKAFIKRVWLRIKKEALKK